MCVLFDFPFCFSLDLSLSCLCFDLGCSWISSWLFADMSSVPTLFVHHCSVWHARAEWCSVGTTRGIHTAALVHDFLLMSFTSRSNFFLAARRLVRVSRYRSPVWFTHARLLCRRSWLWFSASILLPRLHRLPDSPETCRVWCASPSRSWVFGLCRLMV
jgi:hypothetical protein